VQQGFDAFKGVSVFKIDWTATGVNLDEPLDETKLEKDWVVLSEDDRLNVALSFSREEVRGFMALIAQASSALHDDLPARRADEHAALVVTLSSESDGKGTGTNRLNISVTNHGPDSAYDVATQLKSSSTIVHGIHLSLGRVNRGETKKVIKRLPPVCDTDELDPMVVVTTTASNAPAITASSRLRLTPAKNPGTAPLQLSCTAAEKDAAPGQRLHVHCESTNSGSSAIRCVSINVAVGAAAAMSADSLAELAPQARVAFELTPTLPTNAKAGSLLPIFITIRAPDSAPVEQQIAMKITAAHGGCKQGILTRDAYLAKRKKLQSARDSGELSQEEYDRYNAENVNCIE
jgi:hypothetical protein